MSEGELASFWIGNVPTREEFRPLLEYGIGENGLGDFEPCKFCRAVGVAWYDDDFFEGVFLPKPVRRLDFFFPSDEFLPLLKSKWPNPPSANCGVALYYEPVDSPSQFTVGGFQFVFLGTFQWSPE